MAALPTRRERDVIDHLRAQLPHLHKAEVHLAEFILSDPEWVVTTSIKELATRAGVSEPTVMRLCRKLDLEGYSAFKLRLAQDLVIAKLYLDAAGVIEAETPAAIAAHMREAILTSLDEATAGLDPSLLAATAGTLLHAKRIVCMGVGGGSAILAHEVENRLFRLGLSVQVSADPYRQRMSAAIADRGDVFICLSATGKPRSLIESASLARENGALVIAIAPVPSPLADLADHVLPLNVTDPELYFNLPSTTRYAQLFIVDCLAAEMAKQLGQRSVENLKAIRTMLNAHHGPSRNQPVGD